MLGSSPGGGDMHCVTCSNIYRESRKNIYYVHVCVCTNDNIFTMTTIRMIMLDAHTHTPISSLAALLKRP